MRRRGDGDGVGLEGDDGEVVRGAIWVGGM